MYPFVLLLSGIVPKKRSTIRQPKKVDGLIGYHQLSQWWLSTFTHKERDYIEALYKPHGADERCLLTQGEITQTSQTMVEFLFQLATWLRRPSEQYLARQIRDKGAELACLNPVVKPGYYLGRHYSTFAEEVLDLKRIGDTEGAESLLLALIEATEAEAWAHGTKVAPWYYKHLSILYKQRADMAASEQIIVRYEQQVQEFEKRAESTGRRRGRPANR